MKYDIRDINLAPSGHRKIEWVRNNMPLLRALEDEFKETKPFEGMKISLSVHLEAKTAYLCLVLAAGGAQMSVTGSNTLSTQDDVAAALADSGLAVFAYHRATEEEYFRHIEMCLEHKPNIIIDDGGDLVEMLHNKRPDLRTEVIGGCEETTTGVIRLKAMEREGILKFPMVAVNDAKCKHLFDNRYGTGQSTWDSIMRNTNLIVASKTVVVVGYGWCSRGIAMRAAALGAKVIVTEIDPVKAMEAKMDGYDVMKMEQAAPLGDIFVTATGCKHTITVDHMMTMKDRAILANAGHFNVEIDMAGLEEAAVSSGEMRANITGYELPNGKIITGKTSPLLGASSACLLNALKELAGIDRKLLLIAPGIIQPIQTLKVQHMGNHNPRLHSDEVLIALAISAGLGEEAAQAVSKLGELRGCEAHSTVILSHVDEELFKKLGVNISFEPRHQAKKLFHK